MDQLILEIQKLNLFWLHFVSKMMRLMKKIQARCRYLALVKPTQADVEGLLSCLGEALHRMNISDIFSAEGSDGASVNVGAHGRMKAKLQSSSPWLFWSWCFAHRLELACKDAFISPLFQEISEMLLRLYYLY